MSEGWCQSVRPWLSVLGTSGLVLGVDRVTSAWWYQSRGGGEECGRSALVRQLSFLHWTHLG
jgi:hypothetical protein